MQLLYWRFSVEKSWKIVFCLASITCFWHKKMIYCHVQLYSPTFRRRKSCTLKSVNKSRSRLRRRRESVAFFSTHLTIVGKAFPPPEVCHLRSQMLRTARWGWYLIKRFDRHGSTITPCHVAVCVNFLGCKKVIFPSYFAVNRTRFSAQLAVARWLLQMLVLCFVGAKWNSVLFRRRKVKYRINFGFCETISLTKVPHSTQFP